MDKMLSDDLRSRLIVAVADGMSRRAAAERFGVAASTAVRWVHAFNTTGDTRSRRIEAFRDAILAAIEAQKDIALTELAAHRCT
ncbi:helix-turn-helix domain-containing protein [Acetobacteraceae bacterium KSS8]|uniref:Helix-turn-helix domain-containing protein n=1 Tax=Endosaccharibacter trunci TaxID=2812733 RepID=A0ABT1WA51_9PROT|nr:helix-turn-helix domain-containing protein [Acetobacteraceae bacterium KSS8]